MKQLQFIKKNTLEWREVSDPKISEKNQCIVKPLAVSRCDLDLPMLRGTTLFRPPFPIGHEFVGQIEDLSEDLQMEFSVGDRVCVSFQISCGACPSCSELHSNSCSKVPIGSNYGMGKAGRDFGGALSDKVLVPFARQMLIPVSLGIELSSIASLSDNMVEAWKLVGQHLEKDPYQSVLVVGGLASSIGLYTILLARSMSKSDVLYVDTNQKHLKLVDSWGIPVEEYSELPRAHSKKFQVIADSSGTREGWMFGLRSATVDGKFGTASIFWTQEQPIPYLDLYNSGIQIQIGRVQSKEWMPKILNLIDKNEFDPGKVVTKKVSWEDAEKAYLEEETKLVVVR
jgi:alcohol dehydrogenase